MTVEEISKFALDGKNVSGMTCAERCLFLELKEIYRDFKEKKITKQDGELRKMAAVERFKKDAEEFASSRDIYAYHAAFWKRIEAAASEYHKSPSVETADNFFKAVYGAGRLGGRNES